MVNNNTVLCCNCFDLLGSIDEGSIDLIITDPPYGISYDFTKGGLGKKEKLISSAIANDTKNGIDWVRLLTEFYRVLKPGKTLLLFGRTDVFMRIAPAIEKSQLRYCHDFVWLKGDMGGRKPETDGPRT